MTTGVNPKLDFVQGLFKDLVWDPILEAQLALLFIEAPYLGVPPLRWIVTKLAYMVSDKFYAGLKMAVDLQAITIINNQHRQAFDRSAVTLKILAQSYGVESPQFLKAKDEAKAILSRFVQYNR